jgi:hypothetical protein
MPGECPERTDYCRSARNLNLTRSLAERVEFAVPQEARIITYDPRTKDRRPVDYKSTIS